MAKPVINGDTIKVPSNPEFLSDVDLFLEGTLRGFGIDESAVVDIAVSVSELVNNAMIHGNKSSLDKVVTVKITRTQEGVVVIVSDEGVGFDPGIVPDPIADENLLHEVGRGLFIVRSLMDKVDVKATNTGTTVAVTKVV
jgi:serine/threonine-protein kinase RsbW